MSETSWIDSVISHYRIVSKIGAGGMGEVYLAEDTRLDRKVALKILKSKIAKDEDRMRRFMQEAKTASALNHPNIITIFEIGQAEGVHYIATELIPGKTLHQQLSDGPLSVSESTEIAIQITRGLRAAHEAGIIHRDIKPENVMIRPDGLVKILDFGIAKLSEKAIGEKIDAEAATVIESYTNPGVVVGTVSYMSPEQARGLHVDPRSDLFSFGILLYELLTRHQPFTGETINHTIVAILEREPPPLSSFVRDYPFAIESIIRKCLQKRPEDRYQSAAEIHDDLRRLQKRLESEFDLMDSSRGDAYTAAIRHADTADATGKGTVRSPGSRDGRLGNLTQELTPLIGRETEIVEVMELLRSGDASLVTLTGIGGTGKTRLARAVARAGSADFSDGVFFIDLSPITNPDLVMHSIAAALGIEEEPGRPLIETVKESITGKKMLLVIDNFEQVVPAATQLAELDSASAELRILVTSREILNVSREVEYPVQPLATPAMLFRHGAPSEPADQRFVEQIRSVESVRLFVERAKHADPQFELVPANANSIAEICSELEGLPLAIELAAARTKVLTPEMIVARLENRLALLTRGPRDLPGRQQTMRGAVEWSFELLDAAEKLLFCRLSVFAGGFTMDAAESVCADCLTGTEDEDIVDVVTSLVEKSLLTLKAGKDGERRFRMLEVVREYAYEELVRSGGAAAAHKAHAEFFMQLAEKAEPHIQAAQSAEWLDRLELEHDNLRAAMKWSLENSPEIAVRLATATRNFWLLHSHLTEGFTWLKAANDLPKGVFPVASRLKLLNALGFMARFLGDHAAARSAYQQALDAGEAARDKRGVAVANRGLGLLALHEGDHHAARIFFDCGLQLSRESDDRFGIAVSLNFLGDVSRTEGDHPAARQYFEESLGILRELDNKVALSDNLNNLAAAAFGEDDLDAARSYFTEALEIARGLGNKITISVSLDGFAALSTAGGDFDTARQLSSAAAEIRKSIGYEIEPAERRFRENYLTKLSDEDSEAAPDASSPISIDDAIDIAFGKR